jgi:hypothetical protein
MPLLRASKLSIIVALALACSASKTGPAPSISGVSPAVVCNAQIATTVSVAGAGLSPLSSHLVNSPRIELPQLNLVRTKGIDGVALSPPESVAVPDDPAHPELSDLTWTSQESMAFAVCPPGTCAPARTDYALGAGLHSIEVLTASGGKAQLADAFTTVPPPTITSISPNRVCQTRATTFTVTGDFFLRIGGQPASVSIGGTKLTPDSLANCRTLPSAAGVLLEACTSAVVTVPSGLAPGPKDVIVQGPASASCSATKAAAISVVPGPLLVYVSPSTVWSGANMPITLYAGNVTLPVTKVEIVFSGSGASPTSLSFSTTPAHPERPTATVPASTAAGIYDVILSDSSGCPSIMARALTVVQPKYDLARVSPRFGGTASSTAVTIDSPPATPFPPLPGVYLARGSTLVQLNSVARVTATSLSATVPKGLATGSYDVIVVDDANKRVGFLAGGFTVVAAPPSVSKLEPDQIETPGTGAAQVTISGQNFSGSTVTLKCRPPPSANNTYADQTLTPTVSTSTTLTVSVDPTRYNPAPAGGALPGANCLVVVTNADQTTAEFASLVVITPSANLTNFAPGPPMISARRGLGAVAGELNQAARFLYAIGGDDLAVVRDDVEVLPVAQLGLPGTAGFFAQRYRLNTARTQFGAVRIGRFIYAVGGSTAVLGTTPSAANTLSSIERAALLDPSVRPANLNVDLTLVPSTSPGLGGGTYYYRVAGVMAASDPFNPGGETLPSDLFGLILPSLSGFKFQVKVSWDAVPGAATYALYRSSGAGAAGSEVQIAADIGGTLPANLACATTSCTDSGAVASPSAIAPLAQGSTGTWVTMGASMSAKRQGSGVTFAFDPLSSSTAYLYVFGGKNESNALLDSYEYLPITINSDGSQAPAASFTSGGRYIYGTVAGSGPRWRLRAWTLNLASGTYVWAGGGFTDAAGTTPSSETDGAKVSAGGALGSPTSTDMNFTLHVGFGAFAAGRFLYAVGGLLGAPDKTASSIDTGNNPPTLSGWNSCQNCLSENRLDLGAAIQSGYFYVLGGLKSASPAMVSNTIEYTLY